MSAAVHRYHFETNPLPWVVERSRADVRLADWLADNRDAVLSQLEQSGAVLFRGFGVDCIAAFRDVVSRFTPQLMDAYEAPTPRAKLGPHVYTSTQYPASEVIPLHNEMSHTHKWPRKIWFCCMRPASSGGATPLSDSRVVHSRIDPALRAKFERLGLVYRRNYGGNDLMSWQATFGTDDRSRVHAYCRESGMRCEWLSGDRLRTWRTREATATHPSSGERVWFNQAHIFHISNVALDARDYFSATYGRELHDLPYDTRYGDDSEIGSDELEHVRGAYHSARTAFRWIEGDLLLVDNMLAAHGREAFSGERRVLVAMAEAWAAEDEACEAVS
jgi:hypothetical protein